MVQIRNLRTVIFAACCVLCGVHLLYMCSQVSQLPTRNPQSYSSTSRRLQSTRHRDPGTASGNVHSQHDPTTQNTVDALVPAAKGAIGFLCRDLQPETGTCKNALRNGLCYGSTRAHCMRSCGQCEILSEVIGGQLGIPVRLTDTLECRDEGKECRQFVQDGKCETLTHIAISQCKASCGFCVEKLDTEPDEARTALPDQATCADRLDVCSYLASTREMCDHQRHNAWMTSVCRASCGLCVGPDGTSTARQTLNLSRLTRTAGEHECADYHADCVVWAKQGKCNSDYDFMEAHCRQACGLCAPRGASWKGISNRGAKTDRMGKAGAGGEPTSRPSVTMQVGKDEYGQWALSVQRVAKSNGAVLDALSQDECRDDHESCKWWASEGECDKNSGYMNVVCKRSCGECPQFSKGIRPAGTFYAEPLKEILLNNGVLMPSVGFGTAALGHNTRTAVAAALQAGYKHLDSAQAREWYREDLVGKAVQEALANHQLTRDQLFITTKIHPRHLGFKQTLKAFKRSLVDLGTDYVDLLLLHYPTCWGDLCKPLPGSPPEQDTEADSGPRTFLETWAAFEQLYRENKTRAIGVSNFGTKELSDLYKAAKVKPQVLQVHMDPFNQNRKLQAMCTEWGIQMVAYSSLGTQWNLPKNPVLTNPLLQSQARAIHKSVAQVVLRWVLHMGVVAIPRSSNPQHMSESLDIFDFGLSETQIAEILSFDGKIERQ